MNAMGGEPTPEPAEASRNVAYWGSLYSRVEPKARFIKVLGQMLVGVGIALILGMKGLHVAGVSHSLFPALLEMTTLAIVAKGLEYAAGLELAFMLFTDGPDEAIRPLMLGLASAVLLVVSQGVSMMSIVATPLFCLTIGFLFLLERRFLSERTMHGR